MATLGKLLTGLGAIFVVVGLIVWLAGDQLSWLGHLPGDIRVEGPGFHLSMALSLAMWLFGRFFR